jgi:hypothetical protein
MAKQKWEYKVSEPTSLVALERLLGTMDDDGWDLVQIIQVAGEGTRVVAILRRRYDGVRD